MSLAMPLKIIGIRFSEPTVPFEVASELLSYIAYPNDEPERGRFSAALCRMEHLQEAQRNPAWAFSAQRIRPWIFVPGDALAKDLRDGVEILRRRITAAAAILMPHLIAFATEKSPPTIEGFYPTIANISQYIMSHRGLSTETGKTFEARDWAPAKPVAHLAFSFAQLVLIKRWEKQATGKVKTMHDILTPYPDEELLRKIMDNAEVIRTILPELDQVQFSEDDTIKFVPQT